MLLFLRRLSAPFAEEHLDEDVLRALARWPQVPAVSGWLKLTRRGQWLLRERVVTHPHSLAFIAANYSSDRQGRYFFQNEPQRVYVSLERTPWIYRIKATGDIETHTGLAVRQLIAAFHDENHDIYLLSEWGIGLVHDTDLILLDFVATVDDETRVLLQANGQRIFLSLIEAKQLEHRFRFCAQPKLDRDSGDRADPLINPGPIS